MTALALLTLALSLAIGNDAWRRAGRVTLLTVVSVGLAVFSAFASWLSAYPYENGQFRAEDQGWVIRQFLVGAALTLCFQFVQAGHLRPSLARGQASLPIPKNTAKIVLVVAAATAFLILATSLTVAIVTGVGRSDFREGSPALVLILGYAMPLGFLVFAFAYGKLTHPWAVFAFAMSMASVFVGFRGLALTGLLAVVVAASHLRSRPDSKTLKLVGLAMLAVVIGLTALRPQADQGVYGALANRVVYTPSYQIEIAAELADEQSYSGEWFVRDVRSRIGGAEATLQQAVWRRDFPDSTTVGGSYPPIDDFVGNFGAEWWVWFAVALVPLWMWDSLWIHQMRSAGLLLHSCLLVLLVRATAFGLSALVTPAALLLALAVALRRARSRRSFSAAQGPDFARRAQA